MFKSRFKIALRNLWHRRLYSMINVIGLAVGITASFLIFLYVHFELSYDRFQSNADRIYRLVTDIRTPSGTNSLGSAAGPMSVQMKADFPEVESFVRFSPNSILITKGNVKFQEDQTLFADSSVFSVFDFPLLKGNPHTALKEPFSIVLSKTASKKYFGDSDPLGQIVQMTGWRVPARVTGIMKDIPENSQIKADMLVSMTTITENWDTGSDNQWDNFNYITYLLLKPGTNAFRLQAKFPAFLEKHIGQQMKSNQMFYTLSLEPLKSVYLHSKYGGLVSGNIKYVYILSVIGLFILLIAAINFINLTTARATERAKEVGIRKLIGAARMELTRQFMGESLMLSMIAFLCSLILSSLLLPLFNQLAGKPVSNGIFSNGFNVPFLLLLSLTIGLLAGIYPALVLSGFKPIQVLNGRFATGNKGILLRKSLVIAQFTISIILIIGTLVVYRQLHFMRNHDLGFNKDQTLVITSNGDPMAPDFKQEISSFPRVISTAFSSSIPGSDISKELTQIENNSGQMQPATLNLCWVDDNYLTQYHMKLMAGRPFSKDYPADSLGSLILNETAVREFGYSSPEQALGKRFVQGDMQGRIIGIVKDFHFASLQQSIEPLAFRETNHLLYYISIKVSTNGLPNTISEIQKRWEKLIPNRPFDYFFLDEFFDNQYRTETRFGNLFEYFAVLVILISCLGLLGLSSYSTLQRTKEIGIRKVLGGTVSSIVILISRDFMQLIVIAFVLASPLAWWLMNNWLQDFAYRINISWGIMLAAGITAFLVAMFTIGFQAVKASLANPIKSLRTE